MPGQILITGGAGFIGSHLADELLRHGYQVRALDNLSSQVHGSGHEPPDYLDPEVELQIGDVRDADAVHRALDGVDVVYHFASMVGVGQSMYRIADYTEVNNLGTAVLLEALAERPVERLIVASSMSIYGEGLYRTMSGSDVKVSERDLDQLCRGDWEVRGPDRERLVPVPTPEEKLAEPASVYALSKYDQERMCLIMGRALRIPTVALRFFNAYGPRQALSNPYTGVLAIFASRLLNEQPPVIFEDGNQQRDFVSVHDVAAACRLAMEVPQATGQVINIGNGEPHTVRFVAEQMAHVLGKDHIEPEIAGKYRAGDIRHCFADISRARMVLGYVPAISLNDGIGELAGWLQGCTSVDQTSQARNELAARGLMV